jgi:F-type H+-transporting ATPase subunit epsilon
MSERPLRLEVVTPRREVIRAEADAVFFPGPRGEVGILPGHTPFLTALGTGELRYTEGPRDRYLAVAGGFAEVRDDRVLVLADWAETPEEIDVDQALAEKKAAEALLKTSYGDELKAAQARLAGAMARIRVAERNR